LIRRVMENNMVSSVTVSNEIELIKLYVDIESLRFKNTIELTIKNDLKLDVSLQIPPMIIQPFIENAIIHGFDSIDKNWRITIELVHEQDALICTIEDNGVGRAKSKEKSSKEHQSFGISITQKRIENLPFGENKGTTQYIDLKDEHNNALGTKVILKIPIDLK
jgi:LytS/YehU family sensor histidine kinase